MRPLPILGVIGVALGLVALTPKVILVKKINEFVTGFFTDDQLSRIVDISALGIHLNKPTEEIMSDLYDYLMDALSTEQLKAVTDSYKAMATDLGVQGADDVVDRIKKVVAYALSPAVDEVRVTGETPDLAYAAMSRQINPDLVNGAISLVRDTLTPTEWSSVKQRFGSMLRIVYVDSFLRRLF
ncbi:unnamed protein product [Heligmosomoides polygyrus]|uniref:DUF1400 domain-containing protein n=1 Tax=Heligmosomoides polygyrus TaxID=6339 RepID=A0A183GDU2_HELPZ|nr:unnamed protein product [Heligmosomoides polygyrus]